MPEDWYVPLHDFNEHMAMVDYLHSVYPKVHIALHAGELALGLVAARRISRFIYALRWNVDMPNALAIGVSVDSRMNEKDPIALLHEMAERNVLVEIALTSNDMILGVSGTSIPCRLYESTGFR